MAMAGAQLPLDILFMVVGKLINYSDEDRLGPVTFETLRALRQSSKHFACMARIKQVLFKSISFYAMEANVVAAENADFSSIAPFVRQVSFVPSPYQMELQVMDVEKALVAVAFHQARCRGVMIDETIHDFCDVTRIHRSIWQRARVDDSLICLGRAQDAWKAALKQFHFVRDVRLASFASCRRPAHLNLDHLYLSNCGADCISGEAVRRITAKCEASLFNGVVDCLAASRIRATNLSIDDEFLMHIDQAQAKPAWEHLDLGRLESFKCIATGKEPGWFGQDNVLVQACYDAVLEKAHNSIQLVSLDAVRVGDEDSSLLPSFAEKVCPRLSKIELRSVFVYATTIADNIQRLPALKQLVIEDSTFYSDDGEYNDVFEAIRNHANRPHIRFWNVETHFDIINLDCHPGANAEVRADRNPEDFDEVVPRLCRYLYHGGIWDNWLSHYLGG